ncbi:MAG: HAD-IA family hydrolase [Candidatus Hydrogenedentes bacterium]|nr:HAD-IA family hydrolase [Candidatus Hydrogenedentota bacterium]
MGERIAALIFDFDGLIIDTEGPDYESWQELFREFGSILPLDVWEDCIGRESGFFDPLDYLEKQIGRAVERDAIAARRRQRYHDLVAHQPVCPGVQDYINEGKRLGLKLAVASSAPRAWVEGHLSRRALLDQFDCIKCTSDGIRPKPNPDLFRATAERLGIGVDCAIVLEDAPNGILAAKRAGMFCVAVPNSVTRRLAMHGADLRLNSLADIPLSQLLAEAGRLRQETKTIDSPTRNRDS